jgi:hypothetical protein
MAVPSANAFESTSMRRSGASKILEQRHPATQGNRTDDKAIFVDQALSRQRLHKPRATMGHDVFAGLTLEAGDLLAEVAAGDP